MKSNEEDNRIDEKLSTICVNLQLCKNKSIPFFLSQWKTSILIVINLKPIELITIQHVLTLDISH